MSRFLWTLETIAILFGAIGLAVLVILVAEYCRQLWADRCRRARAAKADPYTIKVSAAPGGFHMRRPAEHMLDRYAQLDPSDLAKMTPEHAAECIRQVNVYNDWLAGKRARVVSPEGNSLILSAPDPWHTNPRKPYAIERSFGDGWIAVIHDTHTGNTVKPLWPYEWELIDETRFVVKEGGAATLTEAKIAAVEAFEIEEAKIKYIDERGKL